MIGNAIGAYGSVDTYGGAVLIPVARVEQTGEQQDSDGRVFTLGGSSEANARLIAAAPDLLAALKSARAQLESYEEARSGESYNDTQINAAIAKAEGSDHNI
jgi:hypothetical protein